MNLLWIAGVMVVIFLIIPVVGIYNLLTVKILKGQLVPIDPATIPESRIDDLIDAERFLVLRGFTRQYHVYRSAVLAGQPWGVYGVLCQHAASNTWALAWVEPIHHAIFDWRVSFMTPLADGRQLVTASGTQFDSSMAPDWVVAFDAMTTNPNDQWQQHLKNIEGLTVNPEFDRDQALDMHEKVQLEGLLESGAMVDKGHYIALTFFAAWKVWKNVLVSQRKLLAQKKKSGPTQKKTRGTTMREDVEAYQTWKSIQANKNRSGLMRTGILLISVAAFALAFGLTFTWDFMVVLLVVLFIHECGHLIGMWAFGYRDLQMLFVPFMGALASGKKTDIDPWQEAIILLAGPLPGYMLGLYLVSLGETNLPDWLWSFAFLSIFLNALNLLPFMPLDGGRLINLALFNRFPWLQMIFLCLSIFCLLYAGIVWGEVAGLVIGAVLLISLPNFYRETVLFKYLLVQKATRRHVEAREVIQLVSQHKIWHKLLPSVKWTLVDSLVQRLHHAKATIYTAVGVFTIWIMAIAVPPAIIVSARFGENAWGMVGTWLSGDYDLKSTQDYVQTYHFGNDASKKIEALLMLTYNVNDDMSAEEVKGWQETLENFIESGDLTAEQRGATLLKSSYTCETVYKGCERANIERSLYWLDAAEGAKEQKYAALMRATMVNSFRDDEKVGYFQKLEKLSVELDPEGEYTNTVYSLLGSFHERRGELNLAEEYLLRTFDDHTNNALNYQRQYINFLLRHQRSQEALEKLETWTQNRNNDNSVSSVYDKYLVEFLWNQIPYWQVILLASHDPAQALENLDQLVEFHGVERVELLLARSLLLDKLGLEFTQDEEFALTQALNQVNDIFLWGRLGNSLDYFSSNIDSSEDQNHAEEDYEDFHEDPVDELTQKWYKEMRQQLDRKQFTPVKLKLDEWAELYNDADY